MSLSTDNTGYCCFGSPPESSPPTSTQPGTDGAEFPPAGAACTVLVTYKRGAKLTKAEAKGKDGAKSTFSGKKVAEISLDIEWTDPGSDAEDDPIADALRNISPDGPNAGKAWDWTERFAWDVSAVMVEELDGPNPDKASDKMIAKLKLSGWTKPTSSGAGTSATPNAADPYTVPGTGPLGGVTFPTKPTVAP